MCKQRTKTSLRDNKGANQTLSNSDEQASREVYADAVGRFERELNVTAPDF